MRHCVKRALCVLVSLSVLLTLISVFTLSTTASSASATPTVSVGDKFMIVQTSTGEIWGWGDNSNSVLGTARDETTGSTHIANPVKIELPDAVTSKAISAGANHVLALGSDGGVYAWGNNEYGQLGIENNGALISTPTLVEGLQGLKIIAVSAGRFFSLALTEGGQVYAFGANDKLQLGYAVAEGEPSYSAIPTQISALNTVFITQISAGYDSATAIDINGKAHLWGSTKNAVLGTDPALEKQLPATHSAINKAVYATASSMNHSAFLLDDGTVGFFGLNKYGQYGNEGTSSTASMAFKLATFDRNVTAIAASEQQTVILTATGKVYTAGARVPNDTESTSNTFVSLFGDAAQAPVASTIAAGYQNGAMIAQDGSVWAWGDNSCGQLGKGTVSDASSAPVKVLDANGSAFGTGDLPFVKDVPMLFKTTVPAPTYAVVIPSSINVGELRQTDANALDRFAIKEGFTIEAVNVANLYGEKEIVLSVEPGEGTVFYLDDGNGTRLPFDILTAADAQTGVSSGGVLARFTQNGSVQTWIRVDQSLISRSGVYNGVLTFRYSVVDIEN